jgi:hypothetical protein
MTSIATTSTGRTVCRVGRQMTPHDLARASTAATAPATLAEGPRVAPAR